MTDWCALTILTPDYQDLQRLIDVLKEHGFVENDWCALNRHIDGARVSWGPMDTPAQPRPYRWEVQ